MLGGRKLLNSESGSTVVINFLILRFDVKIYAFISGLNSVSMISIRRMKKIVVESEKSEKKRAIKMTVSNNERVMVKALVSFRDFNI